MAPIGVIEVIANESDRGGDFSVCVNGIQIYIGKRYNLYELKSFLRVKEREHVLYNGFISNANYDLLIKMSGKTIDEFNNMLKKLSRHL
jgi:hypothetical protein